ncbi:MAG: NAD(P)-dependent dehydrogenase (short-subunit alcohol dehydrogenase family) [Saprospiraceae bacterium]|jgi:NAD(P)-dependent dehydrogenase (short-subunit alcohol dehydrogenase family)
MKNILVTGANRGIGLEFVKQYLDEGHVVWACFRLDAGELTKISHSNLRLIPWDITTPIDQSVLDQLPDALHLLINNAGVFGEKGSGQQLDLIDAQQMAEVFATNATAPLMVVQALLDKLEAGKATVANISSKMGSNQDNTSGGVYAYRASKAALCAITTSMAVDLASKHIKTVALHPGWVKTDMTNHTGLVDTQASVQGLRQVIQNLPLQNSGAFMSFEGQVIPY